MDFKEETILAILLSGVSPFKALYKLDNNPACSDGFICILSSALEPVSVKVDSTW